VAVDQTGNIYITGWTESSDLPLRSPLQQTLAGSVDVFVAKLNPAGNAVIYCTYFGGSGDDRGLAIAVDAAGNAYVTGSTMSSNLPIAGAVVQSRFGGGRDAFVAKLSPTGDRLVYSTYVGGSGYESGNGIAVDAAGNAYIAGGTTSADFPVARPVQVRFGGEQDAFVAALDPAGGTLVFSTYLGGKGNDSAAAVAIDSSSNVYVAGTTASPDFPTFAALQTALRGGQDAFISKLGSVSGSLIYSTYLGGDGGTSGFPEAAAAIAVDAAGNAFITGVTSSRDFPVRQALQSTLNGSVDAFVTKLNASGGGFVYSTYIGGLSHEQSTAVRVDGSGSACVTGYTGSSDFPIVNTLQTGNAGLYDTFISCFEPAGTLLSFSTFFGGMGSDAAEGLVLRGSSIVVVGHTSSSNFPLKNALQSWNGGGLGGFIAVMAANAAPDFALSAPEAAAVAAGSSTTCHISVTETGGFSAPLSFSVSGLPPGASANFSPAILFSGGSTELTITVPASTSPGRYLVRVAATDGASTRTVTVSLPVTAPESSFVPIRVNAGGGTYVDVQGRLWSSDEGYLQPGTYAVNTPIAGTLDPNLYQTEHYSASGNLIYQFAVPNGSYTVALRFAELYYATRDQRVFDIVINGVLACRSFDVFAVAGGANKAVDLTFPVSVWNGQVTIVMTPLVGLPKVNAIEITETPRVLTPIRVNAGGGAYSDSQGRIWQADTGYLQPGANSTSAGIVGTLDSTLYQSEHYSMSGNLTYQFPVPNGTYTVTLKFAEIYYDSAGRRLFDIVINGAAACTRVDIFAFAGGANKALDIACLANVSTGQLTITLAAVVGFPKINAIEITQGGFTPIRINAGGGPFTDSHGRAWSGDAAYVQPGTYQTSAAIAKTSDPALYQTEHYSTGSHLNYEFPVPNGTYTVTLKFAEIYYTSPGQRVFDVVLNGTTVYSRLDVFSAAGGGNTAPDLAYPVSVSAGRLSIALIGAVGLPKINAIEIR
jgi:hypothetical protein